MELFAINWRSNIPLIIFIFLIHNNLEQMYAVLLTYNCNYFLRYTSICNIHSLNCIVYSHIMLATILELIIYESDKNYVTQNSKSVYRT